MKPRPKHLRAFSLVELLVVISIIAVLLSITMPALRNARESAKRSLCASNQHEMGIASFVFAEDERGLIPSQYGVDRGIVKDGSKAEQSTVMYGRGEPPAAYGAGQLHAGGYLGDGGVLYCPSQHDLMFTPAAYPKPLGSALTASQEAVRGGYNYNPRTTNGNGGRRVPGMPQIRSVQYTRMSRVPQDAALGLDVTHTASALAHGQGWNVLYGSGHVLFQEDVGATQIVKNAGSKGVGWDDMNKVLDLLTDDR